MTQTAPHRPLAEPFSTGASWLWRALAVSAVLHVVFAVAWWLALRADEQRDVELVDIEVAPPPPMAEALPPEIAKPPELPPEALASAASPPETPAGHDELGLADAGVDAPMDAAIDAAVDAPTAAPAKKKRADAGVDAEVPLVADHGDAGIPSDAEREGGDAGAQIAMVEPGVGSASEAGSAADPGVPGASDAARGSGAPGVDAQPAVDGAPTSAGTAANLLAYFPPGHRITVLIRFDRLRKTEWAEPATRLFKPMPDYGTLFGARDVALADQLDLLVISSPRPRDATATTLVARTQMSRAQMRDFLANPTAPIEWSAAKGGMFGKRTGKRFPGDRRVLLSPWQGWFVLAQPDDLIGLLAAAKADLDAIEAKGKLPPWLATIRTIEQETVDPAPPDAKAKSDAKPETGDDSRGPALVLTLAGAGKRYEIPDLGIGVTTAPSPERLSLAMELVRQGWLVRGNIVFASESDAAEFVQTVHDVKTRLTDSRILAGLLKKQHAFNAITGLSLARTGARVSYATSISIADARALLAAAAQTLDAYFANPP